MFGEKKFFIIHNAVDIRRFTDAATIKDMELLKTLKNKFVLGHIGRFNTQKNHRFLIDLFEAYSKEDDSDCRQNGSWCDAPGTILNFI